MKVENKEVSPLTEHEIMLLKAESEADDLIAEAMKTIHKMVEKFRDLPMNGDYLDVTIEPGDPEYNSIQFFNGVHNEEYQLYLAEFNIFQAKLPITSYMPYFVFPFLKNKGRNQHVTRRIVNPD